MDIIIKNELQKLSSAQNMNNVKKAADLTKSAVSSNTMNVSDVNMIKSILLEAGFSLNDDTLLLVQNLLENEIPINKESLTKLKQSMQMYKLLENNEIKDLTSGLVSPESLNYPSQKTKNNIFNNDFSKQLQDTQNYDFQLPKIVKKPVPIISSEALKKAIFTLINDIQVNKSNVNAVVKFAQNNNMYVQLTEISEILEDLKEAKVRYLEDSNPENILNQEVSQELKSTSKGTSTDIIKEKIFKILVPEGNDFSNNLVIKEAILQEFSINLNESKEQMGEKFEDLYKRLSNALDFIETLEEGEYKLELNKLKQALSVSKDYCVITANLKDSVFIPLPINIMGRTEEAELYILKNNKKNKGREVQSALLSLNMSNMGRIESYIQKEEKNLNIQFKIEDKRAKELIKLEIESLRTLLGEYNLKSVSYLDLDESFNLVKDIKIKTIYDDYSTIDHIV